MRARRIIPIALLLIIVVAVALFFLLRDGEDEVAAYGEAYAICPGPDQFGYRCEDAGGISYIDATNETGLFADEASLTVDLPFKFDFYGTEYDEIVIGSNGTLHFATNFAADFIVVCVDDGPVPYLGEMLAPYWDDLDNRFEGTIETGVVGQEPNRVFVIEWDGVLRYLGEDGDGLSFEVQLHESTNQIVYLYKDATTLENPNGGTAFIGLQSVAADTTLTFSCGDDAIGDRSGVSFVYPETANPDLESASSGIVDDFEANTAELRAIQPKGDVAVLTNQLTTAGFESLPELRLRWLSGAPGREATWQMADVTGDGVDELIYLWRGPEAFPELAQLAIISYQPGAAPMVLLDQWLSTRTESYPRLTLHEVADVTGDTVADLVLVDEHTLALMVISLGDDGWQTVVSAEPCKGRTALVDTDSDGVLDIVRENCPAGERVTFDWQNNALIIRQ